jgi:adhesin/invasin
MSNTLRAVTVAAMGLGALAACSKNDSTTTEPAAAAASIIAISGTDAHLRVGHVVDTLSVFVASTTGDPLAGAVVTWQQTGADASLSAPTSTTDASGIARVVLTTGTHLGSGVITATTGTIAPVSIYLDLAAGAPATLVTTTPSTDSITVGQAFMPSVQVQDAFGNPVAGVALVATESGGMDGDALQQTMLTTDANGMVQDTFVPAQLAGVRVLNIATPDGALTVSYVVDVLATDDGSNTGTTTTSGGTPASVRRSH